MHSHGSGPLDPTVRNLSLSDPRCNSDSCLEFEIAHKASQAAISYTYQFKYGHWTTWFYLIVIFLFTVSHLYGFWQNRKARPATPVTTASSRKDKVVASWRSLTYRRYPGRLAIALGLPSVGLQLLMLGVVIFAVMATFAVRPYYRDRRGYGSPPLAIRTGLMAIALNPLIFALAGKVNFVTMLTGIGYEKLNVLHRWISYVSFALGVAHTVPFIVAPLRDGGAAQLRKQYYMPGSLEVWSLSGERTLDFLG